ncbi:hypothetical protein C5167_050595 [Papaver somniferum]|uniref:MULE transposase domain-containing protein n=1 Tax=Papaver somniferum TaxID=3469 RepID=A0A4Y7KQK1_PAPSO|nr:hypothetical protein C5167_050595 [Papaver somniferum]
MISFAAPLRGFKDGCIKVIGLDACHLYGKHGGCLLAATGLDAQNGLVPLGIFICRNECYENWYLFLKNLKPKIIGRGFTLNFISDRQNGHLFKNFKTHFKGSKLKEHVFNAAKAYKRKHFKVHMNSLLELNQAACTVLAITQLSPIRLLMHLPCSHSKTRMIGWRRGHDEPPAEKKARTCSRCKLPGHNVKTCQGGAVGSNPKKKRARTEVDGETQQLTSYNQGECSTGRMRSVRSRGEGGFFRQVFSDAAARSAGTETKKAKTTKK